MVSQATPEGVMVMEVALNVSLMRGASSFLRHLYARVMWATEVQ
jgi:hypothetical protein